MAGFRTWGARGVASRANHRAPCHFTDTPCIYSIRCHMRCGMADEYLTHRVNIFMQTSLFFQSKYFRWTIKAIAACVLVLIVFQTGVYIGFRKAGFSYRWADNYHRMFGGPRDGFMREFPREFSGRDFMSSHGVVGVVIGTASDSLVIRGDDDVEKGVQATEDSVIRRGRETITTQDIRIGDRVVVLGSPRDDGNIEAKMIRLFESARDTRIPLRFAPPPGFGFPRSLRR